MLKRVVVGFLMVLLFFVFDSSVERASADVAYDYYAKSIFLEVTYPTVNQDVVIKVEVENRGDYAATSTWGLDSYTYDFGDFVTESVSLPDVSGAEQVNPGVSVFYTIRGYFPSNGLKNLSFVVDVNDSMAEVNEENNVVSRVIRIED